jgi:hypothetical protein
LAAIQSSRESKAVSAAIVLLSLSATYAVIVETWSATVLFYDSRGLLFVALLTAAIVAFYAVYGWLIYKTWRGAAGARLILLLLIISGVAVHFALARSDVRELFGPLFVTVFLDGLRIVAALLLILAPRDYWGRSEA